MPLTEYGPVSGSVHTGITYRRLMPDLVPYFEEREVAISSGYTWATWQTLSQYDKASSVAFVRLRNIISMHERDAVRRVEEFQRMRRQNQGA